MSNRKLTPDEIKLLSDKLVDTTKNVYYVGEAMFPDAVIDDSTFDDLQKYGDIFKCDNCGVCGLVAGSRT